jgi:ferredoxin
LLDLSNPFVLRVAQTIEADLLILSFPVYSQNIPLPVRKFLPYLFPKHVVINITYGQISPGNVLKEMETYFHQKGVRVIAGAIIPARHSYLPYTYKMDLTPLNKVIEKIKQGNYSNCMLPKRFKHPLASVGERWRTQTNVKIIWNDFLCTKCNLCVESCPVGAIQMPFQINKKCLRCTKCIVTCPTQALIIKPKRWFIKYLNRKTKTSQIELFL